MKLLLKIEVWKLINNRIQIFRVFAMKQRAAVLLEFNLRFKLTQVRANRCRFLQLLDWCWLRLFERNRKFDRFIINFKKRKPTQNGAKKKIKNIFESIIMFFISKENQPNHRQRIRHIWLRIVWLGRQWTSLCLRHSFHCARKAEHLSSATYHKQSDEPSFYKSPNQNSKSK